MKHLNIEIKAKTKSGDYIRNILKSEHALYKGTDHQVDTYFEAIHGRLKLRQGNIENFLIHYDRTNQKGPKQSDVTLLAVENGEVLKEVLTKALGVKVVVDKMREIYFIDNIKFHLDTVVDLGTFVEIEAIDSDGTHDIKKLKTQCDEYLKKFRIKKEDLIPVSYSDLISQI